MIGFIVAGLIIGALARLLMPGRQKIGLLWTLLLGLAGSVIGGSIANLLGTGHIMELNVIGFVVAVLSAVALLVVAERAGLGRTPDRKRLARASLILNPTSSEPISGRPDIPTRPIPSALSGRAFPR